jgi:hypothetical protein
MKLTKLMLAAAMLLMATMAIAEEPAPPAEGMQMPEMGAPKEMKDLAFLEGAWDVAAKFNMSMDGKTEQWMDSKAVATYSYILDGAAMQCTYNGDPMMPGMPAFKGFMLQMYDRETKQWQAVWTDNMGARAAIYTGAHTEGQTVLQGEDKMGGMTMQSRVSTFNQTPTKFDWKMEMSMDGGKTWAVNGTAVYTKK